MRVYSATIYYLSSLVNLLRFSNFWILPCLLFKKPVIFSVDARFSFAVWSLIDAWTIKEVLIDTFYERTYQIKSTDTVVDVGAAIGEFAIPAAARAKRVYAIECDENRLQLLRENCERNETKNVVIVNKRAKSLNSILKSIPRCDFLKVDCEGCEYEIFTHASRATLAKVSHIALEIHLFTPEMRQQYQLLHSELRQHGFQLTERANEVHDYIMYLYADKVAAKKRSRR